MRILVVDFAGHPFQAELSRALAGRGHDVRHACADKLVGPKGALSRRTDDPPGLSFVRLGSGRFWRKRLAGRLLVGLRFGRGLAQEVRRFNPSVVIASNVPPEALVVARFGRLPITWVWWVQDLLAPGANRVLRRRSRLLAWVVGSVFQRLEVWIARRAHVIVVIASSFKDYIDKASHDKIQVQHNWAPIAELPVTEKANRWAVESGVDRTFNFVYTGTLGWKHNPELLARLALELAPREEARVIVTSEGLGADHLREMAGRLGLTNLLVFPFQEYSRLPEVMGSADVLIAVLEGDAGIFSVPSKILSYLCAARPILGSMPADNLASEIIEEAGAGVTVAPGRDDVFVAEAVALLEADPRKLRRMGAAGRQFAEQNFDIDAIASRFLAFVSRGLREEGVKS